MSAQRRRRRAAAHAAGRPYIILKLAVSLDGRIATRTGHSQWITSEASRARGRALRGEVDAIAVGVSTVLADDPRLTARSPGTKDPVRVVFDSQARTPHTAQLVVTAAETPTVVLTTRQSPPARRARLAAAAVDVRLVRKRRDGRVDLAAGLATLRDRGVSSLLVEGGAALAGAFVDAGFVDEVRAFVAPLLIGGAEAKNALGGRGAGPLSDALRLEHVRIEPLGDDVCIVGYPAARRA